jgi:hypothetical protein
MDGDWESEIYVLLLTPLPRKQPHRLRAEPPACIRV